MMERKVQNRDKNLIDKAKKDLHDVGRREGLGERVDVGPRSWLNFLRILTTVYSWAQVAWNRELFFYQVVLLFCF
jgi:hypothetical protein